MAGFVYIPPKDLIRGVCGDLAQSEHIKDAVSMTYDKVIGGPTPGFNVSMKLDFDSPLVPGGRVSVSGLGGVKLGYVEAEKATMQFVLDAVREKYQFKAADFNLIVISEKMPLFQSMQAAMGVSRADAVQMVIASKGFVSASEELCRALSVWIGDSNFFGDSADVLAVSKFHATMQQQTVKLDKLVCHASLLSDNAFFRIKAPEGLDRLHESVPTRTELSWDRCLRCLHVIYLEAVKKISGTVSPQIVVRRGNGQYRAEVAVTEQQFKISAAPAGTQNAAVAKLLYEVIKHVNIQLGFSILDFHHGLREYLDEYVAVFDCSMKSMLQSGEMLQLAFDETADIFHSAVGELTNMLDINDNTEVVLDLVSAFSADLKSFKRDIGESWNRLQGRQVLRSALEANLPAEA